MLRVWELSWCCVFPTVIGRQGEMINRLQAESGARIQVAPGEKLLGKYELHDDNIFNI